MKNSIDWLDPLCFGLWISSGCEVNYSMSFLDILLILSTLSCSLVTGFIFTYAIIVMPGLSKLSDKEFVRAFQVTDSVIQNNHPLFITTWLGSLVSLLGAILVSIFSVGLSEAWLIIFIGVIYLVGVQGITIFIHLPLNKHIQTLKIEELSEQGLSEERVKFEARWNFYNNVRTFVSFLVSLSLLIFLNLRWIHVSSILKGIN